MNYQRILPTVDVEKMSASHVTIVGGAFGLASDLLRCGLGSLTLVDFDHVDAVNPPRQDLNPGDIGRRKVDAVAEACRRVRPDAEIEALAVDFCAISSAEYDTYFGHTDLTILAADFFPVDARANLEVVRRRAPAVWIGLYRGGRAGEVIHYVPGVTPACYRCICSTRYAAFERGQTKVSSVGGTILDMRLVDAIAGQIAVGILTRGADNRLGRLIAQLGDRNLLQVKIDPEYTLGDRDIFAEYLGDHRANFSFTSIALPMQRDARCPDCAARQTAMEALPCES